MKSWKQAFREAIIIGSVASLASLAPLAVCSRRENGTVWGAINAPSHWIWGSPALRRDDASVRYTVTGFVVHHLSAGFWGFVHTTTRTSTGQQKASAVELRDAVLTTAVAALVDFAVVPRRLSPGFQWRLSLPSVAVVYGLFAIGLAAGSLLVGRRGDR